MAAAAQDRPSFEALIAGSLDAGGLRALADRIGTAHEAAPLADPRPFRMRLEALATTAAQRAELTRLADHIERRGDAGRVRALSDGPADVLFDLALPLLETLRAGMPLEANLLANRYLDVLPQGATGWALLPLYLALQAGAEGDALLESAPPRLVVIAGLSGTGKSLLAGLIGHRIGRVPGARVLRSDVFRKRVMGLPPETRLPPRHYTPQSDEETYEALFESADDHLACASSVILDGTFLRRSERDVVEAIALRNRVPFTGIWLEAPERERIARVEARSGDASDATAAVVRAQSRLNVGEIHWHRIRTNRPQPLIVAAARAALDRVR